MSFLGEMKWTDSEVRDLLTLQQPATDARVVLDDLYCLFDTCGAYQRQILRLVSETEAFVMNLDNLIEHLPRADLENLVGMRLTEMDFDNFLAVFLPVLELDSLGSDLILRGFRCLLFGLLSLWWR